ncbi:MAG TPA: MBL fold metallo-hydrolase [bacterium]|nr:MBL fold metallo-hydrolase [bacterium]
MKYVLTIFGLLLVLSALTVACGGGGDYDVDDDGIQAPSVTDDDDDDDDDDTGDDDIDDDDDTGDDDSEPFNPETFGIKFYDVGLGDSALVEIPGPYTMLIDGGETGQGEFTICPDLEARGIERIDILVMTHPDYDHCGGLSAVFDCAEVGEVWVNGQTLEIDAYYDFLDAVDAWGGTVTTKEEGDIDYLGDLTIATIHNLGGYEVFDDNNLVLALDNGQYRVLMTADINRAAQQDLYDQYGAAVACDVVKMPAHGLGPHSADFVNALNAAVGILSVGENTLGYPTEATVTAYENTGLTLYRTDEDGNIYVRFLATEIAVETEL